MIGALTLDQLRILVTVAEEGSFSAAGRRLGRVQSAISQSTQGLEAVLGVRLFDRDAKTPRLTEAGRALLVQARQVLALTETLQAQAASIASGLEPELVIAVDSLFPSAPLVASLHALQRQFPDLPVTLFTEPILASERRLRLGLADLALCALRPGDTADLVAQPLIWIEMIPVAGSTHPLARETGPISRETLERHVQLVLTDPAAGLDSPSFGVVSPRVWRFVELGRRLDFLKAGFGWCNMPAHMVHPLIESGELARLDLAEPTLGPMSIPIRAIHRRRHPPGPAGRWFLDHLIGTCQGA
jgi:DNA-binding transcriptional LysR family regulator